MMNFAPIQKTSTRKDDGKSDHWSSRKKTKNKRVLLTGKSDATVVGEAVAVEFFKLRHVIHSASVDLFWQHVSTVQKPAIVGSYCLQQTSKNVT